MNENTPNINGLVNILDAFIKQNKEKPFDNIDGALKSIRQYVIDLTSNN